MRSLRTHVLLIMLVAFVPLLVFSGTLVVHVAREQRATFQRGATERTRALLTAIDTELKRSVAALQALAASERLDVVDLAAFATDARRVLASRPEWINIHVAPPSGLQMLNLLRPPEAAFHEVIDDESFDGALATRRPVVGNLIREPFTGQHVFPVRVPVVRGDAVPYVLTALVDPRTIRVLLSTQDLPPDWVGVVLDQHSVIVARTIDEGLVGQPASEGLRAALAEHPEGWFRGRTLEGWPVYSPFSRSSLSGWTVAMGIPAAAVDATMQRSLLYLGAFAVALLGAGVALAWFLSRRAARSLEELAAVAEELGRDRSRDAVPRSTTPTRIAEVEELHDAFARAEQLLAARSAERDRVEATLREAEAELRRSDQRKDQFLAMLGHELRNPLGVVVTAVELLRRTTAAEGPGAEPTGMIERQVEHMRKLLNDLLDVARIAEGRIHVTLEPCDLAAIVRETVDDHHETFAWSGLQLELRAPDHPLWMTGDRIRLAQALSNLLQNSIKYTDPGGRVDVHLREHDGTAILSVRDTGVGMEPEILAQAFEPFSQADDTIDRSRGGLGLGLPLVKGLVEMHGGEVRVASAGKGRGTEVTIELPLSAPPLRVRQPGPEQDAPATEGPHRILVIEDNEAAAHGMQLLLARLGHTAEVALTGTEGLDLARRFLPDVVLCDIGLPGLNGYEVARELRRAEGPVRPYLIAISGYGQQSHRAQAAEAGFDAHLTKPVDFDELRAMLARLAPSA